MKIYTIGHGKKSAEEFFGLLKDAGIQRLLDIRLKNTSQLAGFAKKDDLAFFLQEICGISYTHETLFTPTETMLDTYKKKKGSWEEFASNMLRLIKQRKVDEKLDQTAFKTPTVLLCSCPSHNKCHRKVVAGYLQEQWDKVEIEHL